ncbi:hypothetical protein [Ralstonia sp. GP101]
MIEPLAWRVSRLSVSGSRFDIAFDTSAFFIVFSLFDYWQDD